MNPSENENTAQLDNLGGINSPDPLLACLLYLLKLEGKQHSASSLLSGLPLVNTLLTPELFTRSAARAGLTAKILEKSLSDISNLVLPAVLLLKNNTACVLLNVNSESHLAEIFDANLGVTSRVHLSSLESEYEGYAIYVRHEHQFDERTQTKPLNNERHWFWAVIAKSWKIYRDVLLASFMISLFALSTPLFVMNVYDRVVPNRAIETLWVLAIGIVIVYLFDLLLKILRGYFIELAGKKSDVLLSAAIFEKVLGLRLSHRAASVGSFTNQFKEFESVRNFITTSTITVLVDFPFLFLFLLFIWLVGGPLVLVPLLIMPIVIILGIFVQNPLRRSIENSFQASSQKSALLVESLTNIETIKALSVEGKLQGVWEQLIGKLAYWGQKSRLLSAMMLNVASFFQQLATVLVVVFGVYLISDGTVSMGGLIACVMLTGRAMAPLGQIVNLQINYFHTKTALTSLSEVMEKPLERLKDKSYIHHPNLSGDIEFRNVYFMYPQQEKSALENVNFSIKSGEKIAIIGRIGSGKSTVLKLIMGLFEPKEGAILIDNIEASQLEPSDVRKNIGYVSQDVSLFFGSLRENITYGQLHTDDKDLVAAVNLSGMAEFVRHFPRGLDFSVGERGEYLSGGQRQSVGVARAMSSNPDVYLLDEPTSQMDNSTEEFVRGSLKKLSKDKTLIVVTHKTSMLALVDRVIVMDHGSIIADGPRDAVLEALKSGKISVKKS